MQLVISSLEDEVTCNRTTLQCVIMIFECYSEDPPMCYNDLRMLLRRPNKQTSQNKKLPLQS